MSLRADALATLQMRGAAGFDDAELAALGA